MTWRRRDALAASLGAVTLGRAAPAAAARAGAEPAGDLPSPTVQAGAKPAREEDGATIVTDGGPKSRPAVPRAPRLVDAYRFVSAPDFLNQDVADLSTGGRKTFLDPETGEVASSTSPSYESALADVLAEMGSHGTRDLLVAGDLVEGRWGRDDSGAGVFGPVRTDRQRLRAARRAAAVYYPAWLRRVGRQGLTPYPAVGDHELGDDPWRRPGDPWVRFKRDHVAELRSLYARHVMTAPDGGPRFADRPAEGQARDTAYAVRLHRHVLLITLDVFTQRRREVHVSVDRAQLDWLRSVLRQARRDQVPWVVVQGHTPIAGPVRVRHSTGLRYEGGTRSELWRTMVDGGVDVYLCGEVHDQTVIERDGILQVAHGSLFYRGEASYVVGQATARRLVLENHQFSGRMDFTDRLWTTSQLGAPGRIEYPDPSLVTGTLTARRSREGGITVQDTAGILTPVG